CAYNSSVTGTCTAAHRCVQVCTANVAERCHGSAVTYVDSCGAWGGVVDDCALPASDGANRTCVEQAGTASCAEEAPACTGEYSFACRANDGVRVDASCGLVATLVQCGSDQTCEATASGVACRARAPCDDAPGTISCGTRCVDPLSSRTDCGGCGRACSETQQCVQGACAPIPGCNVVCDSNAQCGAGEVCVYAGDCTLSQCQAVNVLAQDAAGVANLTEALTQAGLVQVAVTIQGPVLTYTLTNLGPAPVANVTVTSTIGKVVAAHASGLVVSGASYAVLQEDPVLRFSVPQLATTKRFTVTADHTLDASYVNLIVNDVTYDATGDLLGAWNATKEALTIGLNSEYDGNQTTFHLTLTPSKTLGGLSVPLEIPKCLAQKAAQLQLNGDYHVVQDDPLIVWQFDRLDAPSEITFSVPKNVSDDCAATI
ncbi:MAG: hypothetical protein M0000_01655, partial [Actinomycetota bacterium]|nr:hypothetical protein [Actinomycetota bacterium]